ncbi:hypothetical protein BOX15_Mlig019675g1 [Macrostomum lignano]|uniref:Uncharacterized protein n=1 Tax=Macrostomum lignano TaxID=282301 RepID=A0A267EW73_9PLAT|nr:hypothetical protein BOX15_Mlig004683g1 [Macrostomum lignano]PAA94668.1 hypothetical protein BOX15_Mlig019675g1 [Macrostomum lignano]
MDADSLLGPEDRQHQSDSANTEVPRVLLCMSLFASLLVLVLMCDAKLRRRIRHCVRGSGRSVQQLAQC